MQGVDSARLDQMINMVAEQQLPVSSVVIVHHGYIVLCIWPYV